MHTKEEINRTIGIRLAALSSSLGVKTPDLAGAMGVSVSQANRIFSAKSTMSAAQLVLAAKRLGVTTAVITEEEKFGGSAK